MLAKPSYRIAGQRGAVMVITLVALTAMILAATALTRSTDTAAGIAGNLAFQQASGAAVDVGIETAVEWLEANRAGTALHDNGAGNGYSASRQDPAAGQTWDGFWAAVLVPAGRTQRLAFDCASLAPDPAGACATDVSGNRVSYAIQRLCNTTGAPTAIGVDCSVSPVNNATGSGKGAGMIALQYHSQVYYRITVRVDGPRNTVSYAQAIVAM